MIKEIELKGALPKHNKIVAMVVFKNELLVATETNIYKIENNTVELLKMKYIKSEEEE